MVAEKEPVPSEATLPPGATVVGVKFARCLAAVASFTAAFQVRLSRIVTGPTRVAPMAVAAAVFRVARPVLPRAFPPQAEKATAFSLAIRVTRATVAKKGRGEVRRIPARMTRSATVGPCQARES